MVLRKDSNWTQKDVRLAFVMSMDSQEQVEKEYLSFPHIMSGIIEIFHMSHQSEI